MVNRYVLGKDSDTITLISNVPSKKEFKGGQEITLLPNLNLIYNGEGDQKLFYREGLGFFSRITSNFEVLLVFGKPYQHTFYLAGGRTKVVLVSPDQKTFNITIS